MSCNNYTASKIPVSVGFDADGNAGSLIETKEIVLTKITAYSDPVTDAEFDLEIQTGPNNKIIFKNDVIIEGAVTANAGVTITGASALSGMSDTNITTPIANGEVLVWSSTDWINATLAEAGILGSTDLANYATNTYVSSNYATSNSLSAYATSAWVNSNFVYTSAIDVTVQRRGTALDALRTLTTTNNTLPYFTGGTAATATLTPFARTDLLAATGAGVVQANLALRPGIEVQIQNESLNDISNIDRGFINTNDVIAWDGANWVALPAPGGGGPIALNSISDVSSDGAANNSFLVYNGTNWIDETPAEARASLGANTVGSNLITLADPGDIRYLKINADNTVSTRTAAEMQQDLAVRPGTEVQTQNLKLQAISDLTATADTLLYFTGANAVATTPITEFARSLLDDSTSAAVRTTLRLTPGTDVQAFDQSLQNISTICDASGASAFGRLLYTVNDDNADDSSILPVPVGTVNQVLKLETFGSFVRPSWKALTITDIGAQPSDPTLTTIAGLTTAADNFIYFTAPDTAATATVTEFARSLLDDSTSAAARTTLGAQPLDDTLTAIASLSPTANTFIYFTGNDLATTAPLTDSGRKFVSCPDTLATGDIFYYNGSDIKKLAKPSKGGALVFRINGTVPEWAEAPNVDGTYYLRVVVGEGGTTNTFSFTGI